MTDLIHRENPPMRALILICLALGKHLTYLASISPEMDTFYDLFEKKGGFQRGHSGIASPVDPSWPTGKLSGPNGPPAPSGRSAPRKPQASAGR